MDETPEAVKMLKYILFGYLLSHILHTQSQPLVTEQSSIVPVPFYHQEELRPDLISSFTENRESFRHHDNLNSHLNKRDDLDPHRNERNSGGHKETRQAHGHGPMPRSISLPPSAQPPPQENQNQRFTSNDGFGSLCSIFRTFLEPRRFHRCHVSNGPPSYFDREGSNNNVLPLHSNDLNQVNHDPSEGHHHNHNPGHMPQGQSQDHRHQGPQGQEYPHPNPNLGPEMGQIQSQSANKRYDHIEDLQINHSGEEESDDDHLIHHLGNPHPPPNSHQHQHQHQQHQDPTKISQSRTMILVPERSCPQGQRRDPRGYCRRLVKIRTNYQYGPPPPPTRNVVRPIPIRYYYSRIVTIPAFQFFFPNV